MRTTIPVVTCDHEDGCTEWMIDHYSMDVSNWRELLDGWKYDPYRYDDDALCPEHNPDAEVRGTDGLTDTERDALAQRYAETAARDRTAEEIAEIRERVADLPFSAPPPPPPPTNVHKHVTYPKPKAGEHW